MSIVIDHLVHSFTGTDLQTVHAVDDISLTINEGEFIAVVGHTGSGKTTFIQHLNALLLPTSGTVVVDGLNTIDKTSRKKIRSLVGMVFQYPEYQLFADTVKDDIAFGPKNRGDSPDKIHYEVQTAMTQVGLDYDLFAEKSPFELSGGEKRRVALAGVLALQPKYIVLDEPMAGLDPIGRANILDTLEKLRADNGCAIIMVSHSMDDVAAHADKVLVLQKGTVYIYNTPEQVFSQNHELINMGLSLPEATKLAVMLRDKGITDVPDNICTYEAIKQYIWRRLSV